jgi:RHS repeat-associated protein
MSYARGDLVQVEDPLDRRTSQLVDAGGRPVVLTDPLRYRSEIRWSALDDPTRITDALGNSVDLSYDANRNLTKVELPPASGTSGPRGTTTYTYDEMNRLESRTDQLGQSNPTGHQDVYTRDLNGNVLIWTNRRGQVMRFCYDPFDRRTFAGYAASGGSPTCTSTFESTSAFTWDGWGRLTGIEDTVGGVTSTITRDYDDLDRLTNETTPDGSIDYTWDDASRRNLTTVDGQTAVDYTWYRNDLLKEVSQGTATVSMTYDQANRLATTTLANGIVQDYGLNAAGGITQISYDKGATSYGKINHRYDAAGRRIKMWGANGRTTLPAATTSDATYDLANRLTSWNGQPVTHDADGNLTSVGSQTFSWNARGQLTATSAGDVGYGYDGLGRRVTRSVAGTPDARYLYDGWNLVQEQSGTGTVTANSMLGPGLGQVFRRSAGADRNYLTDAMGSTLALTSGMATPTVNTEYSYEPYGKPTTTGSSTTNPFAFTGLVWDGESGLYDNRFRQLNPTIARFGSEDRIDVLGGWNLYGYAGNSPSVLTDGLGLDPAFNVPPWLVDTLNWVAFGLGIASFFYPPLAPLATGVSWLSAGLVCANGQGDCTTSLVYAAASTAFVGIGLLPAIARGGIATFIARVAGGWGLVNLEAQSVGAWNPPK